MNRRLFIQWLASLGVTLGAAGVGAKAAAQLLKPGSSELTQLGVGDSLYHPTRYLFIGCTSSNFITVYDVNTDEQVALLNFGIRPRTLEIARDDSMMVVGDFEVARLTLYELEKRTRKDIELPSPLYQAFFVPQSKLLAIALRDQVGMVNYETGELHIYPERFDSEKRDTHIYAYYNLLFSSYSQSFWVLDEEKPLMYRHSYLSPMDDPWETIDLSAYIPSGSGLDNGIASPEDFMVALTTKDGSRGLIYFPEDNKVLSTGPMHTAGSTYRPQVVPYIDFYSRRFLFSDSSGHVVMFDLDKGDEPEHYFLQEKHHRNFSPRLFRSGWLESTWILGGDKGIIFQSYEDPENSTYVSSPWEIVDMWVTGDSKTLYYTLDEGMPTVYRHDIRSREALPPLRIKGVVMGGLLRMGTNNSICY